METEQGAYRISVSGTHRALSPDRARIIVQNLHDRDPDPDGNEISNSFAETHSRCNRDMTRLNRDLLTYKSRSFPVRIPIEPDIFPIIFYRDSRSRMPTFFWAVL